MARPFQNLARLDLVSIRLLIMCIEEGSLAAAARKACISKTNASHRLATLEAAVGQALVIRDPRGVQPTDAGRSLAEHGRKILECIERLNEAFATGEGPARWPLS